MPPIALGIEVAEEELGLKAKRDRRYRARYLARYERFPSQRALMVEENAVRRMHPVGFAVINRDPIGVNLGGGIGRARVKGCLLALRHFRCPAIKLRCRGLIEPHLVFEAQNADGFEDSQWADPIGICCIFRSLEAHLHMTLRGKIINFIRLNFLHHADNVRGVRHIAIYEPEMGVAVMGVLIETIDPAGVERGGAPLDAPNPVALFQVTPVINARFSIIYAARNCSG